MNRTTTKQVPLVLLLGKSGQLGSELQRSLSQSGRLVAMDRRECDLSDHARVEYVLEELKPDVVVNAAAYNDVDRAETERDLTYSVNELAVQIMARYAARTDALLVHYSTDYVFDGATAKRYTEDDLPRPLSCYGASKLAGEQSIRQSGCKALTIRTSWVYATRRNNFVRTILRLASERSALDVVADQVGVPNAAFRIADTTAMMLSRYHANPQTFPFGLYHMAMAGAVSRHAYACAIVEIACRHGLMLATDTSAIRAVTSPAFSDNAVARRPAYCILASDKLERTFGLRLPAWREDLEHVIASLIKKTKGFYA